MRHGVPPPVKSLTSLRLSEEAIRLRDGLSLSLGVSKTAVIELALRELGKRNEVPAKAIPTEPGRCERCGGFWWTRLHYRSCVRP